MNQRIPLNIEKASALLAVIGTIAVLSLLAGSLVSNVNNRHMTFSQGSAWQEALIAAEAGAHQGIAQVEQGLFQNSLPASTSSSGTSVTLTHSGEGPTSATAQYSLTRSDMTVGSISQPFYRVLSTGTVTLPGGKALSMDGRDAVLRKLNLKTSSRTATRTMEAWLRPVYSSTGSEGLRTNDAITLNNHNIFIDSFDSTNTSRSIAISGSTARGPATTMGLFNIAPYNVLAANISTNSDLIQAGNAYVYGDAYTNGGTIDTVTETGHIMGQIYDDFYEEMPPVYAPQWTGATKVGPVNNTYTFTGGTAASPKQYSVNSIKLAGGKQVTFDFGTTGSNPDPTKSYIELYVSGDVSTRGNGTTDGSIVIVNGVNVKIYVGGDLNFSGNGLVNYNNTAASLSIQGITPPTGTSQTFTLAGSATFYGTVYAPGADLKLAGGGNGGQFVGSLAGKTAFLNGTTQIRYDESLGTQTQKKLTSFKIAAWFEDARSQAASQARPF